jgi:hypothetical protein
LIKPEDIYEVLKEQLHSPWGYIGLEGNFKAVAVDGTVDCQEIAKFLNERNKN